MEEKKGNRNRWRTKVTTFIIFPVLILIGVVVLYFYLQLIRQASMLSFNDAFHFLSVLTILILPLVLLMKRGRDNAPTSGQH